MEYAESKAVQMKPIIIMTLIKKGNEMITRFIKETNTSIAVYLTKSRRFRAKIKEGNEPAYEVTIGGINWRKHSRGKEYIKDIRDLSMRLTSMITRESNYINRLLEEEMNEGN